MTLLGWGEGWAGGEGGGKECIFFGSRYCGWHGEIGGVGWVVCVGWWGAG